MADFNKLEKVDIPGKRSYDRTLAILDFDIRLIQSIGSVEIPVAETPFYLSIAWSNLIEFFETRMNLVYNGYTETSIDLKINEILDCMEDKMNEFCKSTKSISFYEPHQESLYQKMRLMGKIPKNYEMKSISQIVSNQWLYIRDNSLYAKDHLWDVPLLEGNGIKFMGSYPQDNLMNQSALNSFFLYGIQTNYLSAIEYGTAMELITNDDDLKLLHKWSAFIAAPAFPHYDLWDTKKDPYSYGAITDIRNSVREYLDKNGMKDIPVYVMHTPYCMDIKNFNRIYDQLTKENIFDLTKLGKRWSNMSEAMDIRYTEKDLHPGLLFENPYFSYESMVVNFIREYAKTASYIYISLYRVDPDSSLIHILMTAATHAKVFVYLEPTARGNEEINIKLAKKLSKYGVSVFTKYHGLKVHAKACLIIDRDGSMRAHMSTGNYNLATTSSYTDYQFLTADKDITNELYMFFSVIFTNRKFDKYLKYFQDKSRIVKVAPISLRETILDEIRGAQYHIAFKCNNLCDKAIINELYRAGVRGVRVEILCRTSNGIEATENIRVHSNNGKYLEHGRMYGFDDTRYYISSADLLLRNLNKRVELMLNLPSGINIYAKNGSPETLKAYMKRCFDTALWNLVPDSTDKWQLTFQPKNRRMQ